MNILSIILHMDWALLIIAKEDRTTTLFSQKILIFLNITTNIDGKLIILEWEYFIK